MKPVCLPELKAEPLDGIEELLGRGALTEGTQDAPLVRAQVLHIAVRETMQQRGIACLGLRDLLLAQRERGIRIKTQDFIDQPEIPRIMQQALFGADLGINADPEPDIRLELRRNGERIRLLREGDARQGRQSDQASDRQ